MEYIAFIPKKKEPMCDYNCPGCGLLTIYFKNGGPFKCWKCGHTLEPVT